MPFFFQSTAHIGFNFWDCWLYNIFYLSRYTKNRFCFADSRAFTLSAIINIIVLEEIKPVSMPLIVIILVVVKRKPLLRFRHQKCIWWLLKRNVSNIIKYFIEYKSHWWFRWTNSKCVQVFGLIWCNQIYTLALDCWWLWFVSHTNRRKVLSFFSNKISLYFNPLFLSWNHNSFCSYFPTFIGFHLNDNHK